MGVVLTITHDGQQLEIDTDSITPLESRLVKQRTGMKWAQVLQGFFVTTEIDGDSVAAIVWLAQRRVNPNAPFPENVPISQLWEMVEVRAPEAEPEVEDEDEDPKGPSDTSAGEPKSGGKSSKPAAKKTPTS